MLHVKHVSKTYRAGGRVTEAVADLTFSAGAGEFVCIVGPSGCGKTTLLKCMSGLLEPSSGTVLLHDRVVTSPPPELALVFQDYSRSLFPWMTTIENLIFPLKRKRLGKARAKAMATQAAESVGLEKFLDHYPWQLSGGMQQRVAIARALAYGPELLVMDEPFASVDAQTRADLEDLILQVRDRFGITVVFVTHDIDESVYLADKVVILSQRPTIVREELVIDLPRQRDQLKTKELPRFAELRSHVYTALRQPREAEEDPQPAVPHAVGSGQTGESS